MKFLNRALAIFALLLTGTLLLPAQNADDSEPDTPPPGGTIITSDELHSDQNTHISIFTGNVVTIGTNFKMTCQEMTVYFTTQNKVQRIVSTGNVVIVQPGRVTHCGHAEYFHDEDKFILTDQPVILEPKDSARGNRIIIFRGSGKMTIDGGGVPGRSTVILDKGAMSPSPADTNSAASSTTSTEDR
jgi:lipopolysaccharide transport protein LptA